MLLNRCRRYKLDVKTVQVDKDSELGKGQYGVVFRGTVPATAATNSAGERARDVAVKMLPQDRTVHDGEPQSFWDEIKFLRTLQLLGGDDNVVDFVGYVAGEGAANGMMLVLEFAANGKFVPQLDYCCEHVDHECDVVCAWCMCVCVCVCVCARARTHHFV